MMASTGFRFKEIQQLSEQEELLTQVIYLNRFYWPDGDDYKKKYLKYLQEVSRSHDY